MHVVSLLSGRWRDASNASRLGPVEIVPLYVEVAVVADGAHVWLWVGGRASPVVAGLQAWDEERPSALMARGARKGDSFATRSGGAVGAGGRGGGATAVALGAGLVEDLGGAGIAVLDGDEDLALADATLIVLGLILGETEADERTD